MTQCFSALGPAGFGSYEVEWGSEGPSFVTTNETPHFLLVPGFVDIHIHGGFGVDFMTASEADMVRLCDHLRALGYEGFLPTTVTADAASVKRAISNLPEDPLIKGFHLEGPFISPRHPGAQPPEQILPATDTGEWDDILNDPRLKVVTLAPEVPGATELTARLVAANVIVSLGHSDASHEEAKGAFDKGARHTTHTFNASRAFHHRDPGIVGCALTDDRVSCELIYDRQHVSRAAAEVLLRCKGSDGVIGVSDCTAAAGLPDHSHLQMWGHECLVSGKSVVLASSRTLAGSTATLLDCFKNLSADFGCEVAIKACSINPRRSLKLKKPTESWLIFDSRLDLIEIKRFTHEFAC